MSKWIGIPGQDLAVFTLDGHRVGSVAEAWPEEYTSDPELARLLREAGSGYFRLTGFGDADLYVPFTAIADFSDERVRLKLTRKQLAAQGWDRPPAELPARA